jgi:hypothetical protein
VATHREICDALGVTVAEELEERRRLGLPIRRYAAMERTTLDASLVNGSWHVT